MPAQKRSLRITEGYRAKMVALRNRAQSEARRVWGQIDQRDLDGTYQVGMLALSVSVMQREAARLSAAYLSAFITSELGSYVGPPIVDARQVGSARNGDALRKALVSPLIGVKVAIKDGRSATSALSEGRSALERMVGLATDTAAREALRTGMVASPHVVGWRRAVKGTCDACMGAATGSTLPAGTPLEIHPNCECVSEAVIRPQDQKQTLNEASLVQVPTDLLDKSIYQWTTEDQVRAFGFEMLDYGDAVPGGYNYSFRAKNAAGEVMGRLDINSAGRDGVIGIVEVEPKFRRQGVATRMLDYFRRYEPDMTLDWGMMTPDGTALRASMPKAWQ